MKKEEIHTLHFNSVDELGVANGKQNNKSGAKISDILFLAGYTHWLREESFRYGDINSSSYLYFKQESEAKEHVEHLLKNEYTFKGYTVDKIKNGYELHNDEKWSYCIEYGAIKK